LVVLVRAVREWVQITKAVPGEAQADHPVFGLLCALDVIRRNAHEVHHHIQDIERWRSGSAVFRRQSTRGRSPTGRARSGLPGPRSRQRGWQNAEPMRLRRGMEAAVPCGKRDLFEWKEQCGSQVHGPNRLDEPNATNEPAVSGLHRAADEVAARLRHVTLDQRAGVEVEAQRSRSRSANTSSDARREEVVNRGARAGWLRAGGVTRPSTISWRRRSWLAGAPAGTMSASG